MKRLGLFLKIIFISSISCIGQESMDSIDINEVIIKTTPILKEGIGSHILTWKTENNPVASITNLADFLQNNTGLYLKSYGNASLATSSIRGGSAQQTIVVWNNMPINSPMIGLIDIALLPTGFAEDVSILLGGNSATQGSGAIGAMISLDNKPNFQNRLFIENHSAFGSFSRYDQFNQIKWGNEKFQFHSKYSLHTSKNDFPYFLSDQLPLGRQSNAASFNQHLQQDIFYRLRKINISGHYWFQRSNRQIPPTIVQNSSSAFQEDQSHRTSFNFSRYFKKAKIEGQFGTISERLDYYDPDRLIESKSHFNTLNSFIKYKQYVGAFEFSIGSQFQYLTAEIEQYATKPREFRTYFIAQSTWKKRKWSAELTVNQGLQNSMLILPVGQLGIKYNPYNCLSIRSKWSKNYLIPSFNDRFWLQGGDPELLPESGYSSEIGLDLNISKTITLQTTAFNRNIDNWIRWAPNPETGFFNAQNITKVWSRGLENSFDYHQKWQHSSVKTSFFYNWIKSTNEVEIPALNISPGDRLIYVPQHKLGTHIIFEYKNLGLQYQHSLTSGVRGINEDLQAFQVGNLKASFKQRWNKINILFHLDINNVWNTDYFIIERRPMPRRNLQFGIKLNYTKIKTN